jgi:hypothetical protein
LWHTYIPWKKFQSGEDNIDWDANTINSVPFEKDNTGGLGRISRIPEEPESENNAAAGLVLYTKKIIIVKNNQIKKKFIPTHTHSH